MTCLERSFLIVSSGHETKTNRAPGGQGAPGPEPLHEVDVWKSYGSVKRKEEQPQRDTASANPGDLYRILKTLLIPVEEIALLQLHNNQEGKRKSMSKKVKPIIE